RLGIKPFAELGANSEALSGSQVDSPCSCRAIFESAPVAMLQSLKFYRNSAVKYLFGGRARGSRMVEVTAKPGETFDVRTGIIGLVSQKTCLASDLSYFLGELSQTYESLGKVFYGLYLVAEYDRHVAAHGDDRNTMVGKPALLGAKLLAGFLPKNNNFEERELEPWYGERAYMRLTVARIQIASPGVLEFIGNLNPLKLIFDFITAWRQEGRNRFEVRERIRSEEFAKTIETWKLLYERAEDLPKRKQDATRGELMAVLLKLIDQQTQRLELLGGLPHFVEVELRQRANVPAQSSAAPA
ncbi:MAG: hypothetical protein WBQ29_08185, partial [Isosphaeraceae bacterium]